MPKFNGNRMLAYLGWGILIGLVISLIVIVFGLLTAALAFLGTAGIFIGTALTTVAAMVLWLGLSSILPGVASGKSVGFGAAFSKVFENFGMLLVLAIIFAAISRIPSLIVKLTGLSFLIALVNILVQIVVGSIILSTMTTLYGMWFEGRRLD